jgi:ribosomal-protein-alanine N-acetyltransferase
MIIKSTRLILTEITWADLENIHLLHSYPEVDEFNTLGIPENIDKTREVIQPIINEQLLSKRHHLSWKIETIAPVSFIGLAGMVLSSEKFKQGEIYYKFMPSSWGKGYGTEVSKALIKSGFEDFNLHRIGAGVAIENKQSIKILEKSGMTREGRCRKILPIRGQWVDNYEYAILEDDPRDF